MSEPMTGTEKLRDAMAAAIAAHESRYPSFAADAILALPEMVAARDLAEKLDALEAQMAGWQETSDYLADRLCGALGRPTEGRPTFLEMVDALIANREQALKVSAEARRWVAEMRAIGLGSTALDVLGADFVAAVDALPPTP